VAVVRARGDLERSLMDVLWVAAEPMTGRAVVDALGESGPAYNTVVTVLDRLTRKGVVLRERAGRVWAYRAAAERDAYTAALMLDALDRAGDRTAALVRFAREMSEAEAAALRAALGEAGER
jgi:predicted transcriptional regulator